MNKLILIGEAPSRSGDPANPLGYDCFENLDALKINLFDSWPGGDGKGSAFPMEEAKKRAYALLPLLRGSRVLFVGNRVARAFRVSPLAYLSWFSMRSLEFCYAIFPHPSGINRWWNDAGHRRSAKRFLGEELERCQKLTSNLH